MLQIVAQFCLFHLTPSHAGCKYFVLSSKVHAENSSRRYICVCIATAVDFSILVSSNEPMENCVAPGLDKFQSIIRSCIVFGQSTKKESEKLKNRWCSGIPRTEGG